MEDENIGMRPLGLGIGVGLLFMILGLPWLIVPLWYLFANIVALATGAGFGSDTVSVPALLVGLVAIVSLLMLLALVVVGLIGRGLSAKRRGEAADA